MPGRYNLDGDRQDSSANMRTLILILLSSACYGQSPCPASLVGRLDTVETWIVTADRPRRYNYYNSDGSLAWGNRTTYDTTLIPVGGSFTVYSSGNKATIKPGFKVWYTGEKCQMYVIAYLDANKKLIILQKPDFDAVLMF